MSHLDEVIARVDAAIDESVIAHMNELLVVLSDDAKLSRDDQLYAAAALAYSDCASWSSA